ncbi:dTMP kinase [Myceligenerans pegani]|uniref:Thymidylate kinase n=1 Tax=Myceligenerans pegani TaxID=2776917 RepID=A0ABR9MYC3_9MICO|nr:dTMP kinase [Myceligenerans sp. TRM 65318]MBE1876115.1 dTMP kinase [Myceligenerans sp. TRM 65318]MBE3018386.1 dTMP kinase [Myceligenerans sp. TRM 65318]
MNAPGFFLVIEGPSGIGKTTVTGLVHDELQASGAPVLATKEPSTSPIGAMARSGTHDYRGLALACLVAADRYHHLDQEIGPALRDGAIVVCDRYVPSSLVLQALDGVDAEFARQLNQHAPPPDLTVILTGAPERTRKRARDRGASSRFHRDDATRHAAEDRMYRALISELRKGGWDLLHHDLGDEPAADVARLILDALRSRRPARSDR